MKNIPYSKEQLMRANVKLMEQNKRYREALEKIKQKGELMNYTTGRESYNGQAEIARKALEGSE